MLAIDLAFAVVNILLKKVLEEGIDHLVLITYRLAISAIFLSPIGYFLERYIYLSRNFIIESSMESEMRMLGLPIWLI